MGALSFPLLAAAMLAALPADLLPGYRTESGPWGTVHSQGWAATDRGRMAAEIAESLARVEARIGRPRGRPFEAVLTPNPREFGRVFQEVTGRPPDAWVAGVAFPELDLLLVRGDVSPGLKPPGERPQAVLDHELAHLVLHADPRADLPRWFDEGTAMWASRQVIDPDDEAFLSGLARLGALKSLSDLERQMPGSHDLANIAYVESDLAVEWLVERYGPGVIGDLLDRARGGAAFSDALRARTGLAPDQAQAEFRFWLSGRRSLLAALASSVSLWTVVALLALLAIARAAVRRRRLLRKMEEKESEEARNPYHPNAP